MKIVSALLLLLSALPFSLTTLAETTAGQSAQNAELSSADDSMIKDFDCQTMQRAHARLINGCFSARRHFSATINQKLAIRELAQLAYAAGELDIEVIEREHPNKRVEVGGDGDMVIDIPFSCDRLTPQTQYQFALESAEDPERIIFDYDFENGVLLPATWDFEETMRFLFKKFHMQAHADYREVVYHACETKSNTSVEN